MSSLDDPTPNAEFHRWLRTQFTTLDEAKRWAWRWLNEWDQEIREGPFADRVDVDGLMSIISSSPGAEGVRRVHCGISMRAMAAHISMALECNEYDDGSQCTNYLQTAFGIEIYNAMCDRVMP